MSEPLEMTPGRPPASRWRRTWLSFSLRTFLLVIAAIAACCGVTVNRARRQRDAVNAIQRLGGTVTYSYMEMSPRTWSTAGKPRGPQWARRILGPHYFDWPNR